MVMILPCLGLILEFKHPFIKLATIFGKFPMESYVLGHVWWQVFSLVA